MKVREVLDQVNEVKPNVFSDARLMDFLNEIESMIWNEVLDKDPAEYKSLSVPDDYEADLIALPPHSKVYGSYIQAMIDFQNEESVSYQNNMAMFNSVFLDYKKYMQRTDSAANKSKFRNYW